MINRYIKCLHESQKLDRFQKNGFGQIFILREKAGRIFSSRMSLTSFIRVHFEFSDIFHRSALKINVTLTLSEEIRESFTYFLEIALLNRICRISRDSRTIPILASHLSLKKLLVKNCLIDILSKITLVIHQW